MVEVGQVLTQMIAFLLFLWILKRHAWEPVMHLLEERRKRIQSEFDRIAQLEKEVEQLKETYRTKLDEIDKEARALRLAEIHRGKGIAEKMQGDAHQTIAQEHPRLEQQLAIERAKAKVELRDFIVDLTIQATSRLIHETLDEATHRRMIDDYVRRVTEIQN